MDKSDRSPHEPTGVSIQSETGPILISERVIRKPMLPLLKAGELKQAIWECLMFTLRDIAAMVDSAAASQCLAKKDDPYLIGYFIGNEPPWPGRETELAQVILDGKDTPMKTALKKYLSAGDYT